MCAVAAGTVDRDWSKGDLYKREGLLLNWRETNILEGGVAGATQEGLN